MDTQTHLRHKGSLTGADHEPSLPIATSTVHVYRRLRVTGQARDAPEVRMARQSTTRYFLRRGVGVGALGLLFVVSGSLTAFAATLYSPVGLTAVIQGQKFENMSAISVPGTTHDYLANAYIRPRSFAVPAGTVGVRARAFDYSGSLIYQSSAWYNTSTVSTGTWFYFGGGTDPGPWYEVYSKGLTYIYDGSAWITYPTIETSSIVTQ